ncbi:MAG: AraC family transcriptional regulator [Deltaproteobacteria bacterium]|nr:AraC family transcriptional regulator [Deltaproteobacteria bacterium]
MNPTLKHIDPTLVVGVNARTTNQTEWKSDTAKLPALWKNFFTMNVCSTIPNAIEGNQIYGVYSDYESDYNGAYTVTAGKRVSESKNLPQGLTPVNIESGTYLVFEGRGPLPEIVIQLWQEIWSYFSKPQSPKRKYTTDFELYKPDGWVAVHVAVM